MKNYLVFAVAVAAVGWMANLGVVPLLRFAAFRAEPAFLAFASLLFVVTRVLETIKTPHSLYLKLKGFILSQRLRVVNLLPAFFLFFPPVFAQEIIKTPSVILLPLGGQKEIQLGPDQVKNYTFGMSEVVRHKFNASTQKMLLKGQKLGYSELIVFYHKAPKRALSVYVVSKDSHLKMLRAADALEQAGLEVIPNGSILRGKGEIKSITHFLLVRKLEKQMGEQLFLEVSLAPELRRDIFGEIYQRLLQLNFSGLSCEDQSAQIACFYDEQEALSPAQKNAMDYLQKKFHVDFLGRSVFSPNDNYLVRFKFFQFEKTDGQELAFGLSQLNTTVEDIFKSGLESLVKQNSILFRGQNISVSTLAEPEIVLRPNTPAQVQLGQDIPYQQAILPAMRTNVGGNELSVTPPPSLLGFRFAGIRVEVTLRFSGNDLWIDYQNEFTSPAGNGESSGSISGSKEKSSAKVEKDRPLKIFQVLFRSEGKSTQKIPYLGDIPILGTIFRSTNDQQNYKSIWGIVELKKL